MGASKWKSALNSPLLPSFSFKPPQLSADFQLIGENEHVRGQLSAPMHLVDPEQWLFDDVGRFGVGKLRGVRDML